MQHEKAFRGRRFPADDEVVGKPLEGGAIPELEEIPYPEAVGKRLERPAPFEKQVAGLQV